MSFHQSMPLFYIYFAAACLNVSTMRRNCGYTYYVRIKNLERRISMSHAIKSKKLLLLVLFLILVLIASGCSSEKKIEAGDAEITVKSDDETVEISSDDETVKAEINLDEGTDLPDGYPEDVFPIYPGSIVVMSQTMKDDNFSNYSVSIKHKDDIEKIYLYYKDITQKGKDLMDMKTQNTYTLAGKIDGYDFGIVVAPNDLGGEEMTMVQIVLTEE